jgi:hypothetical protein
MAFMLSDASKLYMLSVMAPSILNDVTQSNIVLSVMMVSVENKAIMLGVIMVSVAILSVEAPTK